MVRAAILLGGGLGALFDGILLHQILQWHNLLSSVRPPTDLLSMKYNMLWDGLFHAVAWCLTSWGIIALWRAARRPQVILSHRSLGGGLLCGWGLFNLVEGVLDHQVLGVHHVHPGRDQLTWDIAFLLWGGVMLSLGTWLIRPSARAHAPSLGGLR